MMKTLIIIIGFISCHFTFQQIDHEWEERKKRGKVLYEEFCVTCHRENGTGFGKLYPPLAKSDFLINNREASIRAVKYGMQGEIIVNGTKYNKKMDPLGLTNEEVTDIMNYILNAWGNQTQHKVTIGEVEKIQK
jgi:mono/diheme cytochrome c family protein